MSVTYLQMPPRRRKRRLRAGLMLPPSQWRRQGNRILSARLHRQRTLASRWRAAPVLQRRVLPALERFLLLVYAYFSAEQWPFCANHLFPHNRSSGNARTGLSKDRSIDGVKKIHRAEVASRCGRGSTSQSQKGAIPAFQCQKYFLPASYEVQQGCYSYSSAR